MQTQPAVRVGFELGTDGIQFYVFANLDKTSPTTTTTTRLLPLAASSSESDSDSESSESLPGRPGQHSADNGWLRRPGPWPGAEAVTAFKWGA